jgi:hypothetical protein
MRLWYAVRRPVGYVLLALLCYLALGVMHAIPYLFADLMTGRF